MELVLFGRLIVQVDASVPIAVTKLSSVILYSYHEISITTPLRSSLKRIEQIIRHFDH